jgi:hypothetical protein
MKDRKEFERRLSELRKRFGVRPGEDSWSPSDPRGDEQTGFYPQNRPLYEGSLASITKYKQAVTDPVLAERYARVYNTIVRTMWQDGQNDRLIPELLFLYFDYLAQELTDDHQDNVAGQAEIVEIEEKVETATKDVKSSVDTVNSTLKNVIDSSLWEIDSSVDAVYSRLSTTNSTLADILKENKSMNKNLTAITALLTGLTSLVGEGQELTHVYLDHIHKQMDKMLYVLDQDAEPVPPPEPVIRFEILDSEIAGNLEAPTNFFLDPDGYYHIHMSLVSSVNGIATEMPGLQMVGDFQPYGAFLVAPADSSGNFRLDMFYLKDAELPETISFGIQFTQTETGNEFTLPVTVRKYVEPVLNLSFLVKLFQPWISYLEVYYTLLNDDHLISLGMVLNNETPSAPFDNVVPSYLYFDVSYKMNPPYPSLFMRSINGGINYQLMPSETFVAGMKRYYFRMDSIHISEFMASDISELYIFPGGYTPTLPPVEPPLSIELPVSPSSYFDDELSESVEYFEFNGKSLGTELPTVPGVYLRVSRNSIGLVSRDKVFVK